MENIYNIVITPPQRKNHNQNNTRIKESGVTKLLGSKIESNRSVKTISEVSHELNLLQIHKFESSVKKLEIRLGKC